MQKIIRFELSHPLATDVLRLPAGVTGEKSLMMWKELCRTGVYETDGNEHNITVEFFNRMVGSFQKRRKKGIEVPCPIGHTHDPEQKRGRVLWLEVRPSEAGYSLWGIIEFVSEEAKEALKNSDVSIDAPEETVDGDGEKHTFALEHVAFTDYPVVPGMEGFKDVKFSIVKGFVDERWTIDTLIAKLGLVGNYGNVSAAYRAIFDEFQKLKGNDPERMAEAGIQDDENREESMSKKAKFSEDDEKRDDKEREFEEEEKDKDEDDTEMSKKSRKKKFSEDDEDEDDEEKKEFDNGDDEDDEDEEKDETMSRKGKAKKFSRTSADFQLLRENRELKIDKLRLDGFISAEQSNMMKRQFCDEKAVSFSLQQGSNREFKDLCNILTAGMKQDYTEQTGIQFSNDNSGRPSQDVLTAEFERRYAKK